MTERSVRCKTRWANRQVGSGLHLNQTPSQPAHSSTLGTTHATSDHGTTRAASCKLRSSESNVYA